MNSQDSDQQLLKDIKQELDRSCERLDAGTLSQLNSIRHQALEASSRPKTNWFAFSGSAFTVFALVFFMTFYMNSDDSLVAEDVAVSELEEMALLSADESLEFYEDIEFYEWLSMNEAL